DVKEHVRHGRGPGALSVERLVRQPAVAKAARADAVKRVAVGAEGQRIDGHDRRGYHGGNRLLPVAQKVAQVSMLTVAVAGDDQHWVGPGGTDKPADAPGIVVPEPAQRR